MQDTTLIDPFPVYGRAPMEQILPPCPLCSRNDHKPCRYRAGFLYCVTHDCSNPHHRGKR